MAVNRRIVLASRPVGMPTAENFRLEEDPVPEPRHGEVLVRALWLSLDPYMRGRMSAGKSYASPNPVGGVMTGGVCGRVEKSQDPAFQEGDIVQGFALGWQDYAIATSAQIRKVDPTLAPISTSVGILGMPGMTAYFGLLEVGRPVPGDTVLVSAASGAVGAAVGQIAKIGGCRVVGTAGSDDKVDYITKELGFDAGINYRTAGDLNAAVREACPDGVDVYFDNVGGPVTDAAFANLAQWGRVAICGQISQYNNTEEAMGPRSLRHVLINQASVEGFLVFRFTQKYPIALRRMARWIKEGKLRYREDVVEGLERAPEAFMGLLQGKNFGKLVVKVADE